MMMNLQANPLRMLARALIVVALGLGLSGCWDMMLKDSRFQGLIAGKPEAVKQVQDFIRTTTDTRNYVETGATQEYIFQEDAIYLPANFIDIVSKDRDSILKYYIGTMLWRHNISFEQVKSIGLEGIDEVTFNYYKGSGGAWINSLRNDPKNAYIKERFELYKKRAGKNYTYYPNEFNPFGIAKLLRNDEAFKLFLTDNNYAAGWLQAENAYANNGFATKHYIYELTKQLGPAISGVLPNASP